MGVRESLLNTITSVGNSDFVRIVTSAGASSKATVQNLFKSFETGLGAKTSLTTSDYFRVVGSDNNAYKQSVSDVADKVLTLGKSASTTGTVSDLDALVPFTTGYATFDASVSPTGASGAFWYSVIGWGTNARTAITCVDVSGTVYTRVKDYSGWKAWVKQPTRAEVDALKAKVSYTTAFDVTQGTGDTYFYADRVGRTLFLEMVFKPGSNVSANAQIAHINDISSISRTHWSTVTNSGEPVRLVINAGGTIQTESAITANKWVSTSCTVLLNSI